jgi:hypothetical protein
MIADEATPLAANNGQYCPQDCDCRHSDKRYWWWVLAIIGSITGKVAYDEKTRYDEEKREQEEQKNDKKNK